MVEDFPCFCVMQIMRAIFKILKSEVAFNVDVSFMYYLMQIDFTI